MNGKLACAPKQSRRLDPEYGSNSSPLTHQLLVSGQCTFPIPFALISAFAIYALIHIADDEKGVLYEQVPAVNVFLISDCAFTVVVTLDVAVHWVCIRTLMSRMRSGLGAGWGPRGESMLLFIRRSCETKTLTQSSERGVIATGERVIFRRPADRTGCTAAVSSRGGEARRPACGRPRRRTCSSPAYHLWQPGAGPTVEVQSLDHEVAGCGWRTRSADFEDKRCPPW